MAIINSLCVYCGSKTGAIEEYSTLASDIGKILAERNIKLIYGGGSVGMMGILAKSVINNGGEVVGVIPKHLDDIELTFDQASEIHVVPNMHARKKMMFELSDGFLVLPGGLGTLEEAIEVMTWAQMRLHEKPIVLLNHGGYWNPLIVMIRTMVKMKFSTKDCFKTFEVVSDVKEIMPRLDDAADPWLESESHLF